MERERILVIDDEPGVRAALEGILRDEGFTVVAAASGESGIEEVRREPFAAVLLDVWLPGMDGLEALERLRDEQSDLEVVMISGHGTIETAVRATKLGAFDFVEKPLSLEKTLLVLRNALRHRRLELRNRQLLEQLVRDTEIVGRSAPAQRLRRAIDVAAGATAPVLITGEPGSGREGVARRIHAAGRAASGPFVAVPCAALDPASAEQALYGSESEPGRMQLASGGTLLLEDVDRLDPALQRRLAATLEAQERASFSARVLASCGPAPTGLDPGLRRWLEVIPIAVPPLRERREDVPLLAERFLREFAREYGRPPRRLAPGCLAALKAHDWPGNVRELRTVIERALLFGTDESVEACDLSGGLGGSGVAGIDLYREFASLAEGVEAFERYYIARVLAETGADRAAAARRLGLTEPALRERLQSLE